MTWLEKLKMYLKELLGQEIAVVPILKTKEKGLPLYLIKMYTPYQLSLFGKQFVIVKRHNAGNDSPGRIASDVVKLREHFEQDVAVVLDTTASWERKRLIEKGVPFVVPGRQLFLPTLLIDLREHFPRVAVKPTGLSWAAQHTVLRQILKADVENRPMGDVATLLGYSAMMMTNVRGELAALDLCTVESGGRARKMVFSISLKELWSQALPYMRSPVCRRHYLIGEVTGVQSAGTTALALYSGLQSDRLPTCCVWKKRYESVKKKNRLVEIESEEDAEIILEEWHYEPAKLSDTDAVDPLSLYLSLKENPDERIQIALEEILETLPWSKG